MASNRLNWCLAPYILMDFPAQSGGMFALAGLGDSLVVSLCIHAGLTEGVFAGEHVKSNAGNKVVLN